MSDELKPKLERVGLNPTLILFFSIVFNLLEGIGLNLAHCSSLILTL